MPDWRKWAGLLQDARARWFRHEAVVVSLA